MVEAGATAQPNRSNCTVKIGDWQSGIGFQQTAGFYYLHSQRLVGGIISAR
jgi:hypothetical protein